MNSYTLTLISDIRIETTLQNEGHSSQASAHACNPIVGYTEKPHYTRRQVGQSFRPLPIPLQQH